MWLVPLLFFPFHQQHQEQEQESQAVRPKSQFLHFAHVPFIPVVAWSQFVSNYFWSKSASFPSPGKVSTDRLLLFHLQCKLNLWPATGKEGSLTYSNPAAPSLLLHCCCGSDKNPFPQASPPHHTLSPDSQQGNAEKCNNLNWLRSKLSHTLHTVVLHWHLGWMQEFCRSRSRSGRSWSLDFGGSCHLYWKTLWSLGT